MEKDTDNKLQAVNNTRLKLTIQKPKQILQNDNRTDSTLKQEETRKTKKYSKKEKKTKKEGR